MSVSARSGCSTWNPGLPHARCCAAHAHSEAHVHSEAQSRSSCPGLQLLRNLSSFLPSSVEAKNGAEHKQVRAFPVQTVTPGPAPGPYSCTSAQHTAAALTDPSQSSAYARQGLHPHLYLCQGLRQPRGNWEHRQSVITGSCCSEIEHFTLSTSFVRQGDC